MGQVVDQAVPSAAGEVEDFRVLIASHLDEEFFGKQKIPTLLGHFTGIKAAQCILREKSFRLTNPRCSNDRQEIDFAYETACETLRSEAPELAQSVIWRITHSGFEHYVACFSSFENISEADNINLWQAYGDDGRGAALIFDFARLMYDLNNDASNRYLVSNVIYDIDVLRRLVSGLLEVALPHWQSESDADARFAYEMLLGTAIQNVCAFFKDPCFSYEREIRVLRLNLDRENIEFYECEDCFSPYVRMPFSVAMSENPFLFQEMDGALKQCLIGPSSDQKRITAILASTLFHLGHEDPRRSVVLSGKPYRSLRAF